LHSVFTQISELNLKDKDVFPQACIDVFYCNKPRNFILLEKKPAQVQARRQDFAAGSQKLEGEAKKQKGGHFFKLMY